MRRVSATVISALLFPCLTMTAHAGENKAANSGNEAKELSGISILGNKEAPKSLFIVPWKSSEIGVETSLSSRLLNEDLTVVDKEVFERELEFYDATAKQ